MLRRALKITLPENHDPESRLFLSFVVSYVGERPWWHIQGPNKGRRERLKGESDQIKFISLRFERGQVVGLNELCWGKAMVAYARPQQRKKNAKG